MAFAFRHQPFKSIYMLGGILLLLFVRLPCWTVVNLVPSWRPRSTWSLSRTLIVQGLKAFVAIVYATAVIPPEPPKESSPDAGTSGLVWIEPAPSELIVGDIEQYARINNVESVRTAGYWYGPRGADGEAGQKASPGEKVVYHFHGGGYIMGSAHPSDSSSKTCFAGFLEHFPDKTRIFALEYRLSSGDPFARSNPFPAALIDAIAGYRYLLDVVGFTAGDIILSGDSAGGNLAFVLGYYITKYRLLALPSPRGILLLSPTVDWAVTHVGPDSSMERNSRSDYVGPILKSGYTTRALLGRLSGDIASTTMWISPASLDLKVTEGLFAGLPRTCILAGGAEMTLDPMRTLRDRMEADMGKESVTYIEVPECTHDWITMTWFEPERTNTLRTVAQWVEGLWLAAEV